MRADRFGRLVFPSLTSGSGRARGRQASAAAGETTAPGQHGLSQLQVFPGDYWRTLGKMQTGHIQALIILHPSPSSQDGRQKPESRTVHEFAKFAKTLVSHECWLVTRIENLSAGRAASYYRTYIGG